MTRKYSAIVSSFIRPRSPGHSGGEIRDYFLLRKLASLMDIKFISMTDAQPDERQDALLPLLDSYYEPNLLHEKFPGLVNKKALHRDFCSRLLGLLRLFNIPVYGVRHHRDISLVSWQIDAYVVPVLKHLLFQKTTNFIFISPQLNPTLLRLGTAIPTTVRTILLTYDVEAIRLSRLAEAESGFARYAKRLECRRAARFELENLKHFDGVVVVSELDKSSMIQRYELDPDRVLTIENSVDVEYFSFTGENRISEHPKIVFVGNLAYSPNEDAAIRLLESIMPLVQSEIPSARVLIAGDKPGRKLMALSDTKRGSILGPVEDVRTILNQASVVCIPLRAGSGTKYKVLEALSIGRPVVCSSIAAEGLNILPGEHYIEADTDSELAQRCLDVIKHPRQYQEMTHRARNHIEQHYSWDRNLAKLDAWIERIRQMPSRRQ